MRWSCKWCCCNCNDSSINKMNININKWMQFVCEWPESICLNEVDMAHLNELARDFRIISTNRWFYMQKCSFFLDNKLFLYIKSYYYTDLFVPHNLKNVHIIMQANGFFCILFDSLSNQLCPMSKLDVYW